MKGIFTILNYYFSPGRRAAQWPLATAPAAVGDRNLQTPYNLGVSVILYNIGQQRITCIPFKCPSSIC